MKNIFGIPIFIISISIAGVLSAAISHFIELSFWAVFVIMVIAVLINGILAEKEDNQLGGFNDPIPEQINILQKFHFARLSEKSKNKLLIKTAWLPWRFSKSCNEMDSLLRELLDKYKNSYVFMDRNDIQDIFDINNGISIQDDIVGVAVVDENRDRVLSILYSGNWVMLFAHQDINLSNVEISLVDVHRTLNTTGADIGIYSYPDDREWEIFY